MFARLTRVFKAQHNIATCQRSLHEFGAGASPSGYVGGMLMTVTPVLMTPSRDAGSLVTLAANETRFCTDVWDGMGRLPRSYTRWLGLFTLPQWR